MSVATIAGVVGAITLVAAASSFAMSKDAGQTIPMDTMGSLYTTSSRPSQQTQAQNPTPAPAEPQQPRPSPQRPMQTTDSNDHTALPSTQESVAPSMDDDAGSTPPDPAGLPGFDQSTWANRGPFGVAVHSNAAPVTWPVTDGPLPSTMLHANLQRSKRPRPRGIKGARPPTPAWPEATNNAAAAEPLARKLAH